MALRFRKSIRIAPGLRINLAKRGASLSVGGHGLTQNISRRGLRTTVGAPGTGLSYSTTASSAGHAGRASASSVWSVVTGLLAIAALGWLIFG